MCLCFFAVCGAREGWGETKTEKQTIMGLSMTGMGREGYTPTPSGV